MGIPSYYKKLTDLHAGLLSSARPDASVDWLFMDYNCLIYHCIQQPGMPVYEGDAETWEDELLHRVVVYTEHIISLVAPATGVYLAIDGVVPMAKMRQQRLRRFKSQWLAERAGGVKWDTNAITPGTPFMEKLHGALRAAAAATHSSRRWILSDSNSPGEGEHKIMTAWRTGEYQGHVAVYGLDADLIVLSLLTRETLGLNHRVWLFREEMDKGACVYHEGREQFEWFCVDTLRTWLLSVSGATAAVDTTVNEMEREKRVAGEREWIFSYCAAMSILGNDFLPRSLSFTLREEGHSELLQRLKRIRTPLVTSTGEMNPSAVAAFFRELAVDEGDRIYAALMKRRRMTQLYGSAETELGESNWPLVQSEEMDTLLWGRDLREDWMDRYGARFFPGFGAEDRPTLCADYLYGIQWIWAYYRGHTEDVCFDWYYPHALPPLWTWLAAEAAGAGLPVFPGAGERITADQVSPQEQLGLVLPPRSWALIRDPRIRDLRRRFPHYFPTDFSFESVGKRYFWECEAVIPVPSLAEWKSALAERNAT